MDKKNDKVNAVLIENKSGRQAIGVCSVVNATGDCDIAHFAGVPTETLKEGNMLAGWYYANGKNGYQLRVLNSHEAEDENGNIRYEPLVSRRFAGIDGDEVSEFMQLSHAATLEDIKKSRKEDPMHLPVTIATIPQLRMTRRIVGEYVQHDTEKHTHFEDSVGMVSDWRKRGPVYEVPFRTLYSKTVKNLITAGRCTSVTDEMWDIMRVIPCCAVSGEAAGKAAAMTDDFTTLDVKALQTELAKNGVVLHEKDL